MGEFYKLQQKNTESQIFRRTSHDTTSEIHRKEFLIETHQRNMSLRSTEHEPRS